jgi:hypothetical protein
MRHDTTRTETFTSSANTTDQRNDLFTVEAGSEFHVQGVKVYIEPEADSAVGVRVFAGDEPVAPVDDQVTVSGEVIGLPAGHVLSPGDTLEARHDNSSLTDRTVRVIVIGTDNP